MLRTVGKHLLASATRECRRRGSLVVECWRGDNAAGTAAFGESCVAAFGVFAFPLGELSINIFEVFGSAIDIFGFLACLFFVTQSLAAFLEDADNLELDCASNLTSVTT